VPPKIRKLKADLQKAGFVYRPGKGSHTVWYDPSDPENEVTFSGHDGDDAKYRWAQVRSEWNSRV